MTTGAPDVHMVDMPAENTMVENVSIYTDASGTDGEISVAAAYRFTQWT